MTDGDLHDEKIPAETQLERVFNSRDIPWMVLLDFACDCAERCLELEETARREPERTSTEAIRLVRAWLEHRAQKESEPAPEKPPKETLFKSLELADSTLKKRFDPEGQIRTIAVEARQTVELWAEKAPGLAATAAAIIAEMAVEIADAEAVAEREWNSEEQWTDRELDAAMQAAAAGGAAAWAAKSDLDSSAIAGRLVRRQKLAAVNGAKEVSRVAIERAAEAALLDYAATKPERTLGQWWRSLWRKDDATATAQAQRERELVEAAQNAERAWQIMHVNELLEVDLPKT